MKNYEFFRKSIVCRIVVILLFGTLVGAMSGHAEDAVKPSSSVKEEAPHDVILNLTYEIGDFDYPKMSGRYGFTVTKTSIYNKGNFHIGGNLSYLMNYGLVENGGFIFGLGPNFRFDFSKNVFINIPMDVLLNMNFYSEGLETKTATSWGFKVCPSIYAFVSKAFGFFVGPGVFFSKDHTSIGMQCGIAISF